MEISQLSLYKIVFTLEIVIAMIMLSNKLKKRDYYIFRLIISIIVLLAISYLFPIFKTYSYTWWYTSLMFLFLFFCCVGMLFFLYKASWQRLFFIAISSYTLQNLTHNIFSSICHLSGLYNSNTVGLYGETMIDFYNNTINTIMFVITYLTCYVFCYVVGYHYLHKKMYASDIKLNVMLVFGLSSVVLFCDILLNAIFVYSNGEYNKIHSIVVSLCNAILCGMIFKIQISFIDNRKLKKELLITQQLLHKSEEQYALNKENIDLINIKCHYLKHQIREFGSKENVDKNAIKELENIIKIYDSNIKTGNEALDLILTEKSLICTKNHILLKFYGDCECLSFMEKVDLYSLFGNAIDNAIEAVSKENDEHLKTINLIVRGVHSLITIRVENYFTGNIILNQEGLPITTKKDRDYHGYGLKSIKYIVEKYNGDFRINIEDNIFSLSILFSINN